MDLAVTENWKMTFKGAFIGLLLLGNVDNTRRSTPLDYRKQALEVELREKYRSYARVDLLTLDTLKAYRNYYKKFNKTYHVLLQLESIVHKGKSLPNLSPLVDANFAAELDTLLLSAGHDADRLEMPVAIDASTGSETITQMNGQRKALKPDDMMMKDARGVVCSVIYGQDQRTPISEKTRRALYVTYAPQGISEARVRLHLDTIAQNVLHFAPEAEVEYLKIVSASARFG